jgi:undecaprenyl-diphosphatase
MLFAAVIVVLGHASTAGWRRVGLWLAAIVIVLVTAVDRVALGVHYASDVLAGWVVALATVIAMTAAFQQRGNPS